MVARKEADVKPQKGGEQHLERKLQIRTAGAEDLAMTVAPPLSAEEAAVIECLQTAAVGLTAKQLQSRVTCDPDVLERTLKALVERELVARLNTIIPSYAYRSSCRPGS